VERESFLWHTISSAPPRGEAAVPKFIYTEDAIVNADRLLCMSTNQGASDSVPKSVLLFDSGSSQPINEKTRKALIDNLKQTPLPQNSESSAS
jgi:hypothetical protein